VRAALAGVVALAAGAGCQASVGGDPEDEPPAGSGGGAGGAPGAGAGGAGRGGAPGPGPGVAGAGGGSSRDAGAVLAGEDAARPTDGPSPGDAAPPAGLDELAYLSRVVPVLLINVGGRTIPYNQSKIDGTIKVVEDHDGMQALMGTTLVGIDARPTALESRLGIEVRGNSSAGFPQKPYGIEIRDALGEALPVSLFGLPREADFVLHSCYADKTCMRNALTYALARETAVPQGRWAPRTRWVEITIDGRYQGLYLLVEKIKRDKNRVAIAEPAATAAAGDITGGYILSFEGDVMRPPERYFMDPLTGTRRWLYRYPSFRVITPEQKAYVQKAISTHLQALMARPRWADAKRIADAGGWVDYFLFQEITNNNDGYWKSWYFVKQPDAAGGRVSMGPAWDYDIAYGNVNYGKRYCVTNLMGPASPSPFRPIFMDPEFAGEVRCRYHELRRRGGALDPARVEAKLDAFSRHIERAKARDQTRWGNIGRYVWPNNYVGATWADEVRYLKYWIRLRLAWLDAKLPGSCAAIPAPPAVAPQPAPPPARETSARVIQPTSGQAPAYVPIEGAVDPALATFACPPP
jgi:hypothetical protein